MSTYHWLLMLHVTGAFLFLGGSVTAGVLHALALRSNRPSDIALLLRLIRLALPVVLGGALLTLIFGLWLVHHVGDSYGTFWIWAAIVLWVLATYLGERGGRTQARARRLAEQLAASHDAETAELRALLRDPMANALSWAAGLAILGVLALMIWKPGQ